jgi:hypothetical protein
LHPTAQRVRQDTKQLAGPDASPTVAITLTALLDREPHRAPLQRWWIQTQNPH